MGEQGFASMAELGPVATAASITPPSPDEVARASGLRGRLPVLCGADLIGGMVGWAVFGGVFLAYISSSPATTANTWLLVLWVGVLVANVVLGPVAQVRERSRSGWPWLVLVGSIVLAWVLGPAIWPGWGASRWTSWFQFSFALIVVGQLLWLVVSALRYRPVTVEEARGVLRSSPGSAVLLALDGVSRVRPQRVSEVLGMTRSDVDRWLLALKNGGLVNRVGVGPWHAFTLTKRGRAVLDELLGTP